MKNLCAKLWYRWRYHQVLCAAVTAVFSHEGNGNTVKLGASLAHEIARKTMQAYMKDPQ